MNNFSLHVSACCPFYSADGYIYIYIYSKLSVYSRNMGQKSFGKAVLVVHEEGWI